MKIIILAKSVFVLSLFLSACGYQFSGRSNPYARQGVYSVYVGNFVNASGNAGLDNIMRSAVVRELLRNQRLRVVSSLEEADAVLTGTVSEGLSRGSSEQTIEAVSKSAVGLGLSDVVVYSQYSASLAVAVTLSSRKLETLFTQSYARSKAYPSAVQYGPAGNTTSLINDSQEKLAFQDLAKSLALDVYDGIFDRF